MTHFKNLFFVLLVLCLSACSSIAELQRMARGESGDSKRSPASSSSSGSVVIDNRNFEGNFSSNSAGPHLGQNEFGVPATRGGKQSNDPWFGTGSANEGSLWNGETQDNFFFSMNTNYKVGDVIVVKVESDVNDSLNARIASLLGPQRPTARRVVAEEAGRSVAGRAAGVVGDAVGNERVAGAIGQEVGDRVTSALDLPETYVNIDEINVRIVEVLSGRRFRVEGTRRVFIRNAPYLVAMSGVLRHEDIAPNGSIASSRVLESKLELTK
jgi:flagellar basal body L-ring protein FlgH